MEIRLENGHSKTIEEVKSMTDGPMKKFWLLVAIARLHGKNESKFARSLSCEQILSKYRL